MIAIFATVYHATCCISIFAAETSLALCVRCFNPALVQAPRVRINYYTWRPFSSEGNAKAGEHVVLIAFIPCVINHRMVTL